MEKKTWIIHGQEGYSDDFGCCEPYAAGEVPTMSEHKRNPTAIKAKNGELPPKPKAMGKCERDRLIYAKCQEILYKPLVDAYIQMQMKEDVE